MIVRTNWDGWEDIGRNCEGTLELYWKELEEEYWLGLEGSI